MENTTIVARFEADFEPRILENDELASVAGAWICNTVTSSSVADPDDDSLP